MVEVLGDDEQGLVWDGERLGEWLGDGGWGGVVRA